MEVKGDLLPPGLNWEEIWTKIVEDLFENLRLRDEKSAVVEPELEYATQSLGVYLPEDIWVNILQRLSTIDKLRSAGKVCSVWRRLLREPVMWDVIDLRDQKCIPVRVMHALFSTAIERSQGQCTDFSYAFCGSGDIPYLVERSSTLRRLWLRGCSGGWGTPIYSGLMKVASRLCHLEELSLQDCFITPACIEALGVHCPRLMSFSLCHFDAVDFETEEEKNEDALAIAAHLPSLRQLQLIGNTLTAQGLEAILEGCPNLKSLDLRRCLGIDLAQMVHFRHPNDSLIDFLFLV
uniref:F-box/LRR-repeat protein 23 n=1 Tax=Nicotiana tabacum TaxID=4097 RepID=A0A1S4C0Q4_TOBAC|nr:PREDICTED: putative F-box/LRR-repeat protein 23 [Nicotiana tabacum]